MLLLILFSFLAGVVTILSPCILPLLPIILSSSLTGSKKRPFGIVTGFIISFTFFTLFLTTVVNLTGISANFLRIIAVIVIALFGLVLVVPKLQLIFENFASKLSSKAQGSNSSNDTQQSGFLNGVVVGISLGLLWTPCVGPILASVIALALTGSVTSTAVFITLAYAIGTAFPMLAIIYGGRSLIHRVPALLNNLRNIQKVFGVIMILTALAIAFNYDRQFQAYILEKFPSYGAGLTAIEDADVVKEKLKDMDMDTEKTNQVLLAPEIISEGKWFNSEPLKLADLRGKVVLIDFWTYSCINCIRTFPYLRSWHEKYADDGLVIIGIHAPEFEFEKDPDNVAKAIKDFDLKYPIVQDNDFKTWKAYKNRYWPAKYLIDHNGQVQWVHFGEGDYDEAEQQIQSLLLKAGKQVNEKIDNKSYSIHSLTPETYLGYARMAGLTSDKEISRNKETTYSYPEKLANNRFALSGNWTIAKEKAMAKEGASLKFNFESQDLFLVLNPTNGQQGKIEVFLDGEKVTKNAGEDVKDGVVTIDSDRLYSLIKLDKPGRHSLELKFLDSNTEAYAFTFG